VSERLTDKSVQHSLHHLMIGDAYVKNTIVEKSSFSADQLNSFFGALRDGHREALSEFTDFAEEVIGAREHHELDELGPYGQFAGKIALLSSGLAVVERELHHSSPPGLEGALTQSLVAAREHLRR